MSKSVLDKIKAYKLVEIQNDKKVKSLSDIEMLAKAAPKVRSFSRALTNKKGSLHTLIAEIKKASPSVLTDTPSFQGAKHYLNEAKNVTSLPALRKDFMYDTYQVAEARALNADCILIIMASVSDQQAQELEEAAFFWKMDVLLEVHNEIELQRALDLKSKLIGINNRNLKTFETDINITRKLAELVPDNRFLISESGLNSSEDLQDLTSSGASAFLIGESLMRQNDIEFATRNLISKPESEY
jgi:indole-3-glycerol phosphate synthase